MEGCSAVHTRRAAEADAARSLSLNVELFHLSTALGAGLSGKGPITARRCVDPAVLSGVLGRLYSARLLEMEKRDALGCLELKIKMNAL